LNSHLTYFAILACSIAGPLALSFDKKVAFYKNWKYLFPAMILPAIFYITWDCIFTALEIWSFNKGYITQLMLFNLPVEEVLFFFIVPYCCIFIYECIRKYFPGIASSSGSWNILFALGIILFFSSVIFFERAYTFFTFLFLSVTIILLYWKRRQVGFFKPTLFLVSYAVVLIPFLVVNGFLTAIPVVLYNNGENMGMRITTIPFEDIFYGMLLYLLNILFFEYLRRKHSIVATSH